MPTYLAIEGIPGDSVDKGHEGAIDVVSWWFGVSAPAGAQPAPGLRGRPEFTELFVTARTGTASPRLLTACATGQAFAGATLTQQSGTGRGGPVTQLGLTDVRIRAFRVNGTAGEAADALEISFSALTFSVRIPGPDGRLGDPVSTTQPPPTPVPAPGSGGVWRPRDPLP